MFKRPLWSLAATAAMSVSAAAQQETCADRETVITHLKDHYGETRQSVGLSPRNTLIEVYAAPSGSWTIAATFPDGTMCLLASGQAYQRWRDTASDGKDA